jgi:opacity protein-like surface antigen
MVKKTGVGILLSLVFVLFAYSSAIADTPVFKSNDGKWYGSINAGVTMLNDIDFSVAISGSGFTASAAGSYTFDAAPSIGGAVGYVINDFVRTDIEVGYQSAEYDKIKFSGDITFGATTVAYTGEADVQGVHIVEQPSTKLSKVVNFSPAQSYSLLFTPITKLLSR